MDDVKIVDMQWCKDHNCSWSGNDDNDEWAYYWYGDFNTGYEVKVKLEQIDTSHLFDYELNGKKLSIMDLIRIHDFFEAAQIAERIMIDYNIADQNKAMDMAYDIYGQVSRECDDLIGYMIYNKVVKGDK